MTLRSDGGRPGDSRGNPGTPPTSGEHRTARRALGWFFWILGLAMLATVIVAALHFSEERAMVRIGEEAEPWWLSIAVVLQCGTYLAQGETWRLVTQAARVPLSAFAAVKLSLVKLFIDQALPSAGVSGTVVVARALEQRGVPRSVVMAAVVVDTVAYHAAYVPTLALALLIALRAKDVSAPVVAGTLFFLVLSVLLAVAVFLLSGRSSTGPRGLMRIPGLQRVRVLVGEADPILARSPALLVKGGLYQLTIILLDAGTVWVLIQSLGATGSPTGVFASFIICSLLRTISIVPGGLGAYEAASVVTLRLAGVPVAVALAATLLFRALSFWLPMVPGLFFSRGVREKS